MHYSSLLYRALNPAYAAEPLSGEGAKRYGGRFNKKGIAALYTSLSPQTALKESHQVGHLQPTVLVSYEANLTPIFDARDAAQLADYGVSENSLAANDWRQQMRQHKQSESQRFAERLIKEGYQGMLCISYAVGANLNDINLILWTWNTTDSNQLRVIDDENRLPPHQ